MRVLRAPLAAPARLQQFAFGAFALAWREAARGPARRPSADGLGGARAGRPARSISAEPRPRGAVAGDRPAHERLGCPPEPSPSSPASQAARPASPSASRAQARARWLLDARQRGRDTVGSERVEAHQLTARGDRRQNVVEAVAEEQQVDEVERLLERLQHAVGRLVVHRLHRLDHEHPPGGLERGAGRCRHDRPLDVGHEHFRGPRGGNPGEVRDGRRGRPARRRSRGCGPRCPAGSPPAPGRPPACPCRAVRKEVGVGGDGRVLRQRPEHGARVGLRLEDLLERCGGL